MNKVESVCLLGFGEVGQTLIKALSNQGLSLRAFDRQFADPNGSPSEAVRRYPSVHAATAAIDAVEGVDVIISAVTAEQNRAAAKAVAGALKPGAWFLDLNSVSPKCKQDVAALIEESGGRYVEAAIMSPIQPKGIAAPILLGGPQGETFLPLAQSLGFTGASFFDRELGKAAACKMCRSILIKGLESLLTESLLTARVYGVEDTVLESLQNLMPGVDWNEHAAYMIGRSLKHGERRAEEMREVAHTVLEAGIAPRMSRACADTQLWASKFEPALKEEEGETSLKSLLDKVLQLKTR